MILNYIAELNKRPEIQMAQTSYNPSYPQYMVHVDVAKCKQVGVSPSAILSTLQGYYGGLYASNFNAYGKLFRVMIQGSPETRQTEESLNSIYVRTPSGMSPERVLSSGACLWPIKHQPLQPVYLYQRHGNGERRLLFG